MSVPLDTTIFTEEIVQRLLDNIEAPGQADLLKTGYFSGTDEPRFPLAEGYALLQATAQREPVGSRRWFLLQSVLAWAALRVPGVAPEAAYESYRALFDQARAAVTPGTAYALSQTVNDFLTAVASPVGAPGALDAHSRQAQSLLKEAWAAYAASLVGAGRWPGADAKWCEAWSRAIAATSMEQELAPVIEKLLANPKCPPSYALTMLAATILTRSQPTHALDLLKQARVLLPKGREGKEEPAEMARFCACMVEALLAADARQPVNREKEPKLDKLREAVPYQQTLVTLTGHGWARLVQLQTRAGDEAGMKTTLRFLSAPAASGRDINEAAEALIALWHETEMPPRPKGISEDDGSDADAQDRTRSLPARQPKYPQAGRKAVALLKSYLNYLENLNYLGQGEKRDWEQELRARWRLGALYLEDGRFDEARAVLDLRRLAFDPEQIGAQAHTYYTEIQKLRETWQKLWGGKRT